MQRVLVVDDHPGIANAVALIVRECGGEAVVVHSGAAALASLRTDHTQLVVLDVSMPGMSGLDVLREMGVEGMLPGTTVLMFSASEEFRERALRLGATSFILKHDPDDLTAEIARHLATEVELEDSTADLRG